MSIQAFTKEISTMSGEQLIKMAMGPYSVFIELFDEINNDINLYFEKINKICTPWELNIVFCVMLAFLAMIVFIIKKQGNKEDVDDKLTPTNESEEPSNKIITS